ncbi:MULTISPECIES: SAM-dependent methyltransferase [Kitasatospora]|uniref:DNA methylase adenine-specific domain-containing protein n=1 Tax=Kitasatospora setae (strain ATCC 33774 / DSM 43861 / JCM 3304 / KCC A-0304 / NBRC 14216 / KM-6054) TaxID=452652 RepID=E4N104_KITSK|nr:MULTISPECIES: SAM-dependent methyltransferase [Kitasatospora]BAJ31838.1 hypothetical protein KSE_60720 [Kitasatospora setae KM-6054]
MTTDATITAAGVARIAKVGPAAVSAWRKRFPDFPTPTAGTPSSPRFALSEVVGWLRDHGKEIHLSASEEAWQRIDALSDPARPAAVLASFARTLSSRPPVADDPKDPVSVELASIARRLSLTETPAASFESVLARWKDAYARQVEVTPEPIAALMVELVAPVGAPLTGPVFDPACGTGTLLLAAAQAGATRLIGQEIDPDLAELSRRRLDLAGAGTVTVEAGDSLTADAFPDCSAPAAVCNPPFGQRHWGRDGLAYDSRWAYGLPAQGDPELAWLQHVLAHLSPGGRAVIAMPPAAASRPSGRRIRAELVRNGKLQAVISLPPGSASTHSMGIDLWVLGYGTRTSVLFLTAARHTDPAAGQRHAVDWPSVHREVTTAWLDFQHGRPVDEAGTAHVAPITDLLDDTTDLTPATRIPVTAPPAPSLGELTEAATEWRTMLTRLTNGLPPVEPAGPTGAHVISLEDLVSSGNVRLWRGVSRRDTPPPDGPARLLLQLQEAVLGNPPTSMTTDGTLDAIQADDVLILAGTVESARPARPIEFGAVPGPGITVLRPDPEVLDPWFLAYSLAETPGRRRAGTGGRPSPLAPSRVHLPVRSLSDQRRIGTAFRRIEEFRTVLDEASQLGRLVATRLIDGLASGALQPTENDPIASPGKQ